MLLQLNTIQPADGAKRAPKRRGRGIGSGLGKTGGRGHKGQRSRSGTGGKVGFEGGQMPLQRRLPKFGFHSRGNKYVVELRVERLSTLSGDIVDLASLKAHRLVPVYARQVKLIGAADLDKAVTVKGVRVSKGAKTAIEAAGGRVEG